MSDILFDYDKADVRSEETAKIQQIAGFMKENETVLLRLIGFADPRGADGYNMNLSRRRVDTVRQALIDTGVDANRIVVSNLGETQPKCTAATEECYQIDRRVEVYFGSESNAAAAASLGGRK